MNTAKIIQISSVLEQDAISATTYGLGEDNKIYHWSSEKTEWILDEDTFTGGEK